MRNKKFIGNVSIYFSQEYLIEAMKTDLVNQAKEAIKQRGRYHLALAGGNTPKPLYSALTPPGLFDWSKIDLYFSDERCVSPDDENSNYRMVNQVLASQVPIDAGHVHAMYTGKQTPEDAALSYQLLLKKQLGAELRFDTVVLGLGRDGHTASLFPHSPALSEKLALVCSTTGPKGKQNERISLTLPAINRARHILVMVSGPDKAEIVKLWLTNQSASIPIQEICPSEGVLHLYMDEPAASLVPGEFYL